MVTMAAEIAVFPFSGASPGLRIYCFRALVLAVAINPINSISACAQSSACNTFFQLWKFACVGALATLIQFSILILLVQFLGINPIAASVAGYLVSVCFNYYLNYKFTFKARTAHKKTAVMFGLTAGVGLLLNAFAMSLCLNNLRLKYILAQIVATGFVFVWNFTVNKLWTFRVPPGRL